MAEDEPVLSPSLRSYAHGNATLLPAEETEMRVQCDLLLGNADAAEESTRSGIVRRRDTRLMYEGALGNEELRLLYRLPAMGAGGGGEVKTVVAALDGRGETDSVHSAISIPHVRAWRVFSASASALRKICGGGRKEGDGGGKEGDGGTAGSGMVA